MERGAAACRLGLDLGHGAVRVRACQAEHLTKDVPRAVPVARLAAEQGPYAAEQFDPAKSVSSTTATIRPLPVIPAAKSGFRL